MFKTNTGGQEYNISIVFFPITIFQRIPQKGAG